MEVKGEKDKLTITIGDFNTALSTIVRIARQKISNTTQQHQQTGFN